VTTYKGHSDLNTTCKLRKGKAFWLWMGGGWLAMTTLDVLELWTTAEPSEEKKNLPVAIM